MAYLSDDHISSIRKYGKGFLLVSGCIVLGCTGFGLLGVPSFIRWMASLNDVYSTVISLKRNKKLSYGQALGLSKTQVKNLNQFFYSNDSQLSMFSDILAHPTLLTASEVEKIEIYYALKRSQTIFIRQALLLTDLQVHNLNQFASFIKSLSTSAVDSIFDEVVAMTNRVSNMSIISERINSLFSLIESRKISLNDVLHLSDKAIENLQLLQPYILHNQITIEDAKKIELAPQQCLNLKIPNLHINVLDEFIHELPLNIVLSLNDIQRANIISYYHNVPWCSLNPPIISFREVLGTPKLISVEWYKQICRKEIEELIRHGRLRFNEALNLNEIQLYNLSELTTAMLIDDSHQRSGINVGLISTFSHALTSHQITKLKFFMSYGSRDMTYGCLHGNILTIAQMLDLNDTQIDMLRYACIRYLLSNKRELSERVLHLNDPHHIRLLKTLWVCSWLVNDLVNLDRILLLTSSQADRIGSNSHHEFLVSGSLKLGVVLLIVEGRLNYTQAIALSDVQQTLLDEASAQILAGHATVIDIIGALPSPILPFQNVVVPAATYLAANNKLLIDLSSLKEKETITPLTPKEISQYSDLIESSDQVPDSEKAHEKQRLREYQENIICGITKEPLESTDEPITVTTPPTATSKGHHQIYDKGMLIQWVISQKDKIKNVEDPCTRYPLQDLLRDGKINLGYTRSIVHFIKHVRQVIAFYIFKLNPRKPIDRPPTRELRLAWLNSKGKTSTTSGTEIESKDIISGPSSASKKRALE